jgi:hypothetical protein
VATSPDREAFSRQRRWVFFRLIITLPAQQDIQAAIAEPATLVGQLAQLLS